MSRSARDGLQVYPTSVWNRWLHGSSELVPTKDDLTVLKDATLPPARDPDYASPEEAIKIAEACMKATHTANMAKPRRYHPQHLDIDRMPFHVFNDVDAKVFAGALRGNVVLRWAKLPREFLGITTQPGKRSSPRILIELSKSLLSARSKEIILRVLLHQMTHAYFVQCCGFDYAHEGGKDVSLAHNLPFSTLSVIIQRLIVGISCYIPSEFGTSFGYLPRPPRSMHYRARPPSKAGSTCCFFDGHGHSYNRAYTYYKSIRLRSIPKLNLEKIVDPTHTPRPISQYFHVLEKEGELPVPRLRCEYDPSIKLVELHFQGRAIPIARDKLFAAHLTEKLFDKGTLQVPGSSLSALQDLLSFLRKGRYGLDLDQRRPYTPGMDWESTGTSINAFQGPPRILEHRKSTPPPLLSDIKAYRLAAQIDFPELRLYALRRMYARQETHDDPFEILEWVYLDDPSQNSDEKQYEPKSESQSNEDKKPPFRPDSEFRKWVRDWLQVPSGDHSYPYNLQILQRQPAWKDSHVRHGERKSELIADIESIEAGLRERHISAYARMPVYPYVQPSGYFAPGPYGPTPYQAPYYAPPTFPHHGHVSPMPMPMPMPMPPAPSHSVNYARFERQLPYMWNHQPLPTTERMPTPVPETLMHRIDQMWPGVRPPHDEGRFL